MASKIQETPQKGEIPEKEGPETLPDSPLLGLSDGAVRELVRSAKKRGHVTRDQINSVLPSEQVNSGQIEDVLAMFSEMGVNVVETEETSSAKRERSRARRSTKRPRARAASWSRSSRRSRPSPRPRSRPNARMIRCACICAKWARWSFCRV